MIKLLLVDDEPLILDGIIRMMDWGALDISVIAACHNALNALEVMKDDMPDILLADVEMPGMSGLELVEQARMLNPELRSIILSAYDDFTFARRALRAGVIEYLLKPVSEEDLRSILLKARDEIMARRAQCEEASCQRRAQTMELVQRLTGLYAAHSKSITAAAVRDVCVGMQDDSILQEAMTYIVTHSVQGLAQAEWSLRTVKSLYVPSENLYENSAQALIYLMNAQENKHGFVQQMQDYVQMHYDMESLSLQYLADHQIYLSAEYIGKEFARATGMKFSAYLLSVRMERAKYLLAADPELHTYEIAEQVGLGHNPRYFSQLFRKYTGMTPSDFSRNSANTSDI